MLRRDDAHLVNPGSVGLPGVGLAALTTAFLEPTTVADA